jgi:hypothetical protein
MSVPMIRRAVRRPVTAARLAVAAVAACLLGPLTAAAAGADLDRDTLEKRVAEAFDARVLKVREGTLDGRTVWFVTMMREGGNDNAAFKVDTLAFDPETGAPLRSQMPNHAGSETMPRAKTSIMERRPEVLRDRPWR